MTLIVVDEVVDEVPSVDENFAAAQMRAKLYNATSGAIPNRGETEEEYLNCIEGIMFGENEARKTRSSSLGDDTPAIFLAMLGDVALHSRTNLDLTTPSPILYEHSSTRLNLD